MALKIGIVGLPNSGKSTLFNTLVGQHLAKVADYPFTTIEPNVGVIAVPDEQLDKIAELLGGVKKIPATIKFIDIAGLVEGAHQGKGLGNQFLAHIREVDALVLLVRSFDLPASPADPAGSAELVKLELQLAGIAKPTLVAENNNVTVYLRSQINSENSPVIQKKDQIKVKVNAQTGETVGELIKAAYQLLDLITFYTLKDNPPQVQAWPIKKGSKASEAAGKIHTDFQKGFIKAEVTSFHDFVQSGGWQQARAGGKLRFEGRDYEVADADIIKIRFKV